jgi:hypothetical protein
MCTPPYLIGSHVTVEPAQPKPGFVTASSLRCTSNNTTHRHQSRIPRKNFLLLFMESGGLARQTSPQMIYTGLTRFEGTRHR